MLLPNATRTLYTKYVPPALHQAIHSRIVRPRPKSVSTVKATITQCHECALTRDAKKHVFFKPCFLCQK